MKRIKIIFLFSMFLLVYSCFDKKTITPNYDSFIKNDTINSLKIDVTNDSVFKDAKVLIEIEDTLNYGKQNFGNLYSVKMLHDSIRRDPKEDVRGVVSCIGIHNEAYTKDHITGKSCDSFYQANLDFEMVRIPFYITPRNTGRLVIEVVFQTGAFEKSITF